MMQHLVSTLEFDASIIRTKLFMLQMTVRPHQLPLVTSFQATTYIMHLLALHTASSRECNLFWDNEASLMLVGTVPVWVDEVLSHTRFHVAERFLGAREHARECPFGKYNDGLHSARKGAT